MREGGLGQKINLVIAVQEYVPTIIVAKIKNLFQIRYFCVLSHLK